jgi:hypothetical protein
MTEVDWIESSNPHQMMHFVDGEVIDRKLRLFACACCRRIWDLIESELHRRVVELAERFADGSGRVIEWEKGEGKGRHQSFRKMLRQPDEGKETVEREDMLRELEQNRDALTEEARLCRYHQVSPEMTAEWTLQLNCRMSSAVADFASRVRAAPRPFWKQPFHDPTRIGKEIFERRLQEEMREQAIILRDIIGNPFRLVTIDQTWQTPRVVMLAQNIYQERAFHFMPTLGDALKEAGCDNDVILAHCLSRSEHVLGCWVVDALRGII